MPHVNLPGSVSLYYEMHTPTCKPDPTKPSLLLLAPSWGNVLQLKDYVAAFKDEYSVCTIEPRSHGRSINPVTATFDFFVAASDIAFAMEALQLPPSHIFGAGTQNFQALLKLAILFPSQVLSLSLVGLSSLPEDEAIWAECVEAIGQFVLTEVEGREEAWDRFLPSVVRLYNPYKARNVWMSTQPNQRVSKITPELLGEIEHPLLLIQGEADKCFPAEDVAAMAKHLTRSRDLRFHIEAGGPHLLALTHARSVIPRMRDFLAAHAAELPPVAPLDARRALERAARIASDPKIALRNPGKPDSFSLLSADELATGQVKLDAALRQEQQCRLHLPMCFEKQDWEADADAQRRWTWSTRAEYARRHEAARPVSVASYGSGIAVNVHQSETTSMPSSPMTGTCAPFQAATLDGGDDDDVPPPLPSKIRV